MTARELEQLYRDASGDVLRALRSYPEHVREDAAAAAWETALRHPERIGRDGQDGTGYVIVCARHEAARMVRRDAQRAPLTLSGELPDVPGSADVERAVIAREQLEHVGELAPLQQRALVGRMLGMTYAEIGADAGRGFTWANRHVGEGRRALRDALGEA